MISHLLGYVGHLKRLSKFTTRKVRLNTGFDEGTVHRSNLDMLCSKDSFVGRHEYKGNLYGYPMEDIEIAKSEGHDLITDVGDLNVAIEFKQKYPDFVKLVFLDLPYSKLVRHIQNRAGVVAGEEAIEVFKSLDGGDPRKYLESMNRSSGNRIDSLLEELRCYDSVMPYADFITGRNTFPQNQKEFRNFILENRG